QYTITETAQSGWTNTDPADGSLKKTVTVSCDNTKDNPKTVKFGNQQQQQCTGCLKIYKYEDKNGNHQKDYDESYLSGWTFNVTDSRGNSQSGITGTDGYVTICDLAAGQYTITETAKDGWTNTDPADGSRTKTVTVSCDNTKDNPKTVKFGNQKQCTGCLKIYKYEDKNGNHQKDYEESYLSGWTFNVTDSRGNSQSGTTGTDGYVTICNLAAGQYTITENPKDGWTNTDPADGSRSKTVTVTCGTTKTVKFGNQKQCSGCLKIYKYNDKNGDGTYDPGWPYYDSYLSGWVFTVTDSRGNSQSVTTGTGGYVTICNLVPGQYTITETPQSGWTNTDPADGSLKKTVTVECGKTTTVKFGNKQVRR
ncbi:MAG: SpaA isopeptide-forming pilin-related protein, partial [Dehalococcoidia bacterium]